MCLKSQARQAFDYNCLDIDRLMYFHQLEGGVDRGRRSENLEVLNKSAIVLICAVWEAYCEDIVSEAIRKIVEEASSSDRLGTNIKKIIAIEIKKNPNELQVWKLADHGWRNFLIDRYERLEEERNRKLNTPKSNFINQLFDKNLGISNITSEWYWQNMTCEQAQQKLDEYVTLRGDIAHRARNAQTLRKTDVNAFLNHVKKIVEKTDIYVLQNLRTMN